MVTVALIRAAIEEESSWVAIGGRANSLNVQCVNIRTSRAYYGGET